MKKKKFCCPLFYGRNMKRTISFKITDEYENMPVSQVLHKKMNMSSSLIRKLKQYPDGILLNGERTRIIDSVSCADVVEINIHEGQSQIKPEKIPLDIVYEDEDVLIICKQPGLPTHPSHGHCGKTVANAATAHYLEEGEEHIFRPVNRLDMDTSGLMCIAKNSYANAILCSQLESGALRRRYTAIAVGGLSGSGTIDAPIIREDFLKRKVDGGGQRAVTHYKVIENFGEYTLLELWLETGRTHQIRVHMSYIGYPLLGDWLYGTEDKKLFERQALHSSYLEFIHPVTGEKMEFERKMAVDMKKFIDSIKNIEINH